MCVAGGRRPCTHTRDRGCLLPPSRRGRRLGTGWRWLSRPCGSDTASRDSASSNFVFFLVSVSISGVLRDAF